jgi:hypothetical protein
MDLLRRKLLRDELSDREALYYRKEGRKEGREETGQDR